MQNNWITTQRAEMLGSGFYILEFIMMGRSILE
jgi:hypothetical protein